MPEWMAVATVFGSVMGSQSANDASRRQSEMDWKIWTQQRKDAIASEKVNNWFREMEGRLKEADLKIKQGDLNLQGALGAGKLGMDALSLAAEYGTGGVEGGYTGVIPVTQVPLPNIDYSNRPYMSTPQQEAPNSGTGTVVRAVPSNANNVGHRGDD